MQANSIVTDYTSKQSLFTMIYMMLPNVGSCFGRNRRVGQADVRELNLITSLLLTYLFLACSITFEFCICNRNVSS